MPVNGEITAASMSVPAMLDWNEPAVPMPTLAHVQGA